MLLRTVFIGALCALRVTGAPEAGSDFITEPQDVQVAPGDSVQLDCELISDDASDICSWRISGTGLGVDHFYNVFPPPKVRSLFPDHQRVCSIVIEDIDERYAGGWTCWPLGPYTHFSSRTARVTVGDVPTSPAPRPSTTTEPSTPATSSPKITTKLTTTLKPSTVPSSKTTPAPPNTTSKEPWTTTEAPSTTSVAPSTTPRPTPSTPAPTPTSPVPGFTCPVQDGLYSDPSSERYFFYCENGNAIRLQCEVPQKWNDSAKRCMN